MPELTAETQTENKSAGPARIAILVVDDDALITIATASALRRAGYDATAAASPTQALALCTTQRFDLAIVDQRMPDMTGTELARQLLQQHDLHSVFLSAYDDTEYVSEAALAGALSYVLKPIDPVALLPVIHTALNRITELRALRQRTVQLREALAAEREINTVIGILMMRAQVTRDDAFDMLRRYARSQRVQVFRIATEMLQSVNSMHAMLAKITRMQGALKPRLAGQTPDHADE